MILEEETYKKYGYYFKDAKTASKVICKCDYCSTIFESQKSSIIRGMKIVSKQSCVASACANKKRQESMMQKYGAKHSMHNEDIRNKQKQTIRDRYGVENAFQSEEIKEKIKQTNRERLGKDYPTQSDAVKSKVKKTLLEKYGVDNPNKSEDVRSKSKKTNLELYGSENPFGSKEIQKKIKETNLKKYGVENPIQDENVKAKAIQTNIEKYGVKNVFSSREIRDKIKQKFLAKYGKPYPDNCFGKTQDQIQEWLSSVGQNFESDYDILENKEIDLLSEDKQIGIEYCGLYWHTELSPQPRGRYYHYDKYKKCFDNGVFLITIFGDEWAEKREICKSIIKSKLGIYKERVYARKCSVKEVDKFELEKFCKEHHLQGYSKRTKIGFGLYYNGELVAILSVANHHRNSDILTLNRLCFKKDVQILGGASKLFSRCLMWMKNNGYNQIITWSDNRWSDGSVYLKLGFSLDAELPPDYSYVNMSKTDKRLSKQSQKKLNTKCPSNMTELEWATERGLARIWDCGKKRWKYESSKASHCN